MRTSAAAIASRPRVTGAVGALLIAFSAILVRFAAVTPSTSAFYRCAYALPVLGLLAALERRRFGPRGRRARTLAFVAGLFFAIDLLSWHFAIEYVGAGLATVLANTQVVLVPLVAWAILRERPQARVLLAVPVALSGVVLISGVLGGGGYGSNPLLGTVLALVTAVAYSGFILVLRAGNRDLRRPAGPLFDATFAAAVALLVAGTFDGSLDLAPSWPAHGWLVVLALSSQVVAWLLISVSLPRLPAAITSLLLSLQPVGSVALGRVLLGETPSPTQYLGVLGVLAALAIATLARRDTATAPVDAVALPAEASARSG